MSKVDMTQYLTYIRKQGGPGCWGYATLAIWDVMNEMQSANPPNLSMHLWLMMHARRDLWADGRIEDRAGRFHTMSGTIIHPHRPFEVDTRVGPEWGDFFQNFGCPTEGTEPHIAGTAFAGNFTDKGTNEALNYRLAGKPTSLPLFGPESEPDYLPHNYFRQALLNGQPIRLEAGSHVVAILGFDDDNETFTYVDSAGDRAHGGDGFATFTYEEIDAGIVWLDQHVDGAYIFEIVPPRPVPVAEIWVRHDVSRLNVNLWLSVDGSSQQRKKLWPPYEIPSYATGRPFDDSRTLHYRVPLPAEAVWPPSASEKVVLDLYDSNFIERGPGGGEVVRFAAAFGHHFVNSNQVLADGPIPYQPFEHHRLTIP